MTTTQNVGSGLRKIKYSPIKFEKHVLHLRVSTQDQSVYGVILSLWSKIYKENVTSSFNGKLNKLVRCQLVKLIVWKKG